MCGRYTFHHAWADIFAWSNLIPASEAGRNIPPRYNIAPARDVLFVTGGGEERELHAGR